MTIESFFKLYGAKFFPIGQIFLRSSLLGKHLFVPNILFIPNVVSSFMYGLYMFQSVLSYILQVKGSGLILHS